MDSEPRTTLPLDVLLHIIELLAGGDDRDSIRSLSQACKSMVPLCRNHLFSSLRLLRDSSIERFGDLLSKNPDIARYVRILNYRVDNPNSDHVLNILDMLKERSSLQSIELSSPRLYWNSLPESIRSSLISLIQLPTVTRLTIDSFNTFPATVLSGCSNLIELQLGHLCLEVNQVISRSKIPTLVTLSIRRGTSGLADLLKFESLHGGPINFSRVQKVIFEVESQDDIHNINKLIKETTRLEYITIGMYKPVGLAGLGESLAINAYQTLTFLGFGFSIIIPGLDPICGLNSELRFIAGTNILEELRLEVYFRDASSYLTDFKVWSAFESTLTDPGAFPMLRRVEVKFGWYSIFWNLIEPEQHAILENLKENMFPRLVESKVVEFNFIQVAAETQVPY